MNTTNFACLAVASLSLTSCNAGRPSDPEGFAIARARDHVFRRSSTTDPTGGNADARPIPAGGSLVLADVKGPGVVTHLWFTIAHDEEYSLRRLVLEIYWDDNAFPSVLSPVGDFFGLGHGGDKRFFFSNAFFDVSPQLGLNCYLPMPFKKSARVVIKNEGEKAVGAFYAYVDWCQLARPLADGLYLNASYRQAFPAPLDEDYLFAEVSGARGHLLGVNVSVEATRDGWWGEGDDHIVVDGEPVMAGTGTEDYFCGAWDFGADHAAPYSGSPRLEPEKKGGRHCLYRFHATDTIPFKTSFRYGIEHGHANDRADNWSSVAYWYADRLAPLPPLPPVAERLPGRMPVLFVEPVPAGGAVVEGEALVEGAVASTGKVEMQELDGFRGKQRWSGEKHLWWTPAAAGATLELHFDVATAGRYEVAALLTAAPDYGTFELALDGGKPVAADAFDPRVKRMAPVSLGTLDLAAGSHALAIHGTGRNEKSKGFLFGLDGLVLRPAR
jgi:D-arabinan exo alpha-(1,3)/(1,5)-arabinofuranosidase (non-reducing end)